MNRRGRRGRGSQRDDLLVQGLMDRIDRYTCRESIACAGCGRPADDEAAEHGGWYRPESFSPRREGLGILFLYCPECAARELERASRAAHTAPRGWWSGARR